MSETEKPKEEPKEVSQNALELRIKELENEVQNAKVAQRVTEIHSVWASYNLEGKSTEFLDGVIHALKNYKPVAKNAVSVIPPAEPARIGEKVIDEDNLASTGGQMQ